VQNRKTTLYIVDCPKYNKIDFKFIGSLGFDVMGTSNLSEFDLLESFLEFPTNAGVEALSSLA